MLWCYFRLYFRGVAYVQMVVAIDVVCMWSIQVSICILLLLNTICKHNNTMICLHFDSFSTKRHENYNLLPGLERVTNNILPLSWSTWHINLVKKSMLSKFDQAYIQKYEDKKYQININISTVRYIFIMYLFNIVVLNSFLYIFGPTKR